MTHAHILPWHPGQTASAPGELHPEKGLPGMALGPVGLWAA